jgi:hypothetical protein
MTQRPPVEWTARALAYGTIVSAVLLAAGFAVNLAGGEDAGRGLSVLGVLVLLVTPAAGLVATILELRRPQPRAALLAVAVLVVLALALTLAVAAPRAP